MDKYDRQLRLWSGTGQQALRNAHLLVLGVSVATTELIKNVVLAGIGHVTIVDDQRVTAADWSGNFFMRKTDEARNRAAVVSHLIGELNPDVRITAIEQPASKFVDSPTTRWTTYTVVVCSHAGSKQLEPLGNKLFSLNLPLVQVESIGFYGRIRIFFRDHTIIESHPESLVDLRFSNIWPEMREYADSIDLAALSEVDHEHVAYNLVLIKALDAWTAEHGSIPSTLREKQAFRKSVAALARVYNQENIEEAVKSAFRVSAPAIPPGLAELLADPAIEEASNDFYLMALALKQFVAATGQLPLSGVLPDMKTDTAGYIKLQQLYGRESERDYEQFSLLCDQLSKSRGLQPIDGALKRLFSRNSKYVRVIRGVGVAKDTSEIINTTNEDGKPFSDIFRALDAASTLLEVTGGRLWDINGASEAKLYEISESSYGDLGETEAEVLRGLWRTGGGELHTIAAFMGGLAAQEVSKLIMHQYTPLSHTCVYHSISEATHTFATTKVFN